MLWNEFYLHNEKMFYVQSINLNNNKLKCPYIINGVPINYKIYILINKSHLESFIINSIH